MSRNFSASGGGKLAVPPWQGPRHRPTEKETSSPGIFATPQSPIANQIRRGRDTYTYSVVSSPGGSSGSSYSSACYTPQGFRSPSKHNINTSSPKKKVKTKSFIELTTLYINEDDKLSKWTKYFANVDDCLVNYYRSPDQLFEQWTEICALRQALENAGRHILKQSVVVFNKDDICSRIWMAGYYQCIVVLRNKKNASESRSVERLNVKTYFGWMLQKGIDYFNELIEILKVNYGMVVKDVANDMTEETLSLLPKESYHGVHVLSKIYVFLGDLYRYYGTKHQLDIARENYEWTRRLFPYKGRAYTQIAQIAACRNDIISNVYYTLRAQATKYPSEGCRNNLLDIFDRMYRSYKESYESSWHYISKWIDKKQHGRKEIWIYPYKPNKFEPGPRFCLIPRTKKEHISELSSSDCFHKFVISYTHLIGEMYTKIGTDDLTIVAENTLVYFEGYLLDTNRVKFHRLMQIASMNMYVLNAFQEQKSLSEAEVYFEEMFVAFFLEMLSIVVDKLEELIRQLKWNSSLMHSYTAFIMVCIQWLELKPRTWNKPRFRPIFSIRRIEDKVEENEKNREDDVWTPLAGLLTRICPVITRYRTVLFPTVKYESDETHNTKLTFPERTTFAGFQCFEKAWIMRTKYYVKENIRKDRAQIFVRLQFIYDFGVHFLLKYKVLEMKVKEYGLVEFRNIKKVNDPLTVTYVEGKPQCGLEREHLHYWTVDLRRDKEKPPTPVVTNSKNEIPRRTDACRARIWLRYPKKYNQLYFPTPPLPSVVPVPIMPVYEIYRKLFHQRMKTDIIVMPKQIVLDTNCFVLYLHHVMLLSRLVNTPILIPVSVVLELKGLQKGGFTVKDRRKFKSETDPGAAEQLEKNKVVARTCKLALKYINSLLGRKFLVVTCYGRIASEMESIFYMIKDDYYDRTKTNDDRILDACIYMEGLNKHLREKDLPYRIYRNSILLTSDRMMHIASFDNNIPTRHITAFTHWLVQLRIQSNKNNN